MSLWSLLASPLLIGCDMTRLDDFTLSLLSNDEVLAVNQDALGKQATLVSAQEDQIALQRKNRDQTHRIMPHQVWARPLEDGGMAVGLFNLGNEPATVTAKWADVDVQGEQVVRDLWHQKDLGHFEGSFAATVPPHGVVLVKLTSVDTSP